MLASHALLVPSSPTLLIEERRGNTTAMLEALAAEATRLGAERPDAIVVVTSRWSGDPGFLVDDGRKHTSLIDRPAFGVEPRYDCRGEPELARAVLEQARRAGLHAATARRGADSGVSVPLHFLAASRFAAVVPASVGEASAAAHRMWGAALRQAMTAWGGRAMLVVSGSLTFHEHSFNMRREIREDRELDLLAIEAMQGGQWSAIERRAARFPGKAHPETGWKHLEVLRGFLGEGPLGQLCAYETLPGIGEALVTFDLGVGSYEPPAPEAITPAPVHRRPVEPERRRTGIWRAPPPPGDASTPPRPAAPRSSASRTPVRRPGSSRPSSSRPASSRPFSSRPASSRPGSSRPASSRPASSRPFSSRPASSRPASSRPASSRPASSRSASSRPASSRPASSRPPRTGPPRSGVPRNGPPRSGPPRSGPPRSGPPRSSGSGAFRSPRPGAPRPGAPRGPRPSSRPPVRTSARPPRRRPAS